MKGQYKGKKMASYAYPVLFNLALIRAVIKSQFPLDMLNTFEIQKLYIITYIISQRHKIIFWKTFE